MPTVHARAVRRAAEIVGGIEVLARHLNVQSEPLVRRWQEGELPVPQEVFLRCADIISAHQLEEMSGPNPNNSAQKAPG